MNKSYSKIRHIKESNIKLERRFLMEQTDDDFMPLNVGEINDFFELESVEGYRALSPKKDKLLKFKVISAQDGKLVINDGSKELEYNEIINTTDPKRKQRYFCLSGDNKNCITDRQGGFTKNCLLTSQSKVLNFLGASTKNLTLFDNKNFNKEVLESKIPVVVDFSAVWCGPCRQVGLILDEIKPNFDKKILIGKLDVDLSNEIAKNYGIKTIPVIIIFKDGKEIERINGKQTKEFYIDKFNSILNSSTP